MTKPKDKTAIEALREHLNQYKGGNGGMLAQAFLELADRVEALEKRLQNRVKTLHARIDHLKEQPPSAPPSSNEPNKKETK